MHMEGSTPWLELLLGISGAFRPKVLTCLMGVTGAGKTTLMDVLAGRKTGEPPLDVCRLTKLEVVHEVKSCLAGRFVLGVCLGLAKSPLMVCWLTECVGNSQIIRSLMQQPPQMCS